MTFVVIYVIYSSYSIVYTIILVISGNRFLEGTFVFTIKGKVFYYI